MTDIRAKVIADSTAAHSPRLFTVETRAPTMIHQEVLRHRRLITEEGLSVLGLGWEPDFAYSVSSTRAVPFAKLLQEARDPALRAAPVHWGSAARGMVPGEEIDDTEKCIDWSKILDQTGLKAWSIRSEMVTKRECCRRLWDLNAQSASRLAELMVEYCDPHKSIPNRMIAPYVHYNVLMTGTEPGWLNFFGLRLDGAADPIVRALAEAIWREWNESKPRTLKPGEWHLPYADDEQSIDEASGPEFQLSGLELLPILQKMSVARCAHLSYTSFETGNRMTVEQCLSLYDRLLKSLHVSPMEHQASPDEAIDHRIEIEIPKDDLQRQSDRENRFIPISWTCRFAHPEQSGVLGPGWRQMRMILGESIAPLPEAYR